jgi:hypothetical protein
LRGVEELTVLSLAIPTGPVNLGSVTASTSSQTISAPLGVVTVTDTRGGTAGWTVTAGMTNLSGPQTTATSATASSSYVTPSATITGAVHGNNTATWEPTISVTIPPGAPPGIYTSTITYSVS